MDRCYHLICDITQTFGNESNFIQCRKCKKEFRENTQDFGIAVGTFGHPEHVMYYGSFKGSAVNEIWYELQSLKSQLESTQNELIGFKHGHSNLLKIIDEQEKQLEQANKVIDEFTEWLKQEEDYDEKFLSKDQLRRKLMLIKTLKSILSQHKQGEKK